MRHALALLLFVGCRSGGADDHPREEIRLEEWNAGGLPVSGDIRVVLTGFERGDDLSGATGAIEVSCGACVVRETKLSLGARKGRTSAWGDQSLTVPTIDLGNATGRLTLEQGRGQIEGRSDGQLAVIVSGTIAFAPEVGDSAIDLTWVLAPRPDLDPDVRSLFWALGSPDRSGAVTFRLRGTLDRPRTVR